VAGGCSPASYDAGSRSRLLLFFFFPSLFPEEQIDGGGGGGGGGFFCGQRQLRAGWRIDEERVTPLLPSFFLRWFPRSPLTARRGPGRERVRLMRVLFFFFFSSSSLLPRCSPSMPGRQLHCSCGRGWMKPDAFFFFFFFPFFSSSMFLHSCRATRPRPRRAPGAGNAVRGEKSQPTRSFFFFSLPFFPAGGADA